MASIKLRAAAITAMAIAAVGVLLWACGGDGLETFTVTGRSMEPTLSQGTEVLVEPYSDTLPAFGDLVVYRVPGPPQRFFVHRVIGLPGETVEVRNETLFINGEPLGEEAYIDEPVFYTMAAVDVPQGFYFVLGDNRNNSPDSHLETRGPIPFEDVIGRVVID